MKISVLGTGAVGRAVAGRLDELETARGPEMFLALWVRTAVALGGSDFNIKVVRGPSLPA